MAIRYRKDRKSPYQVYWNNPFTGKRESANFATEQEAKKHDSLIKHRLKFDRKSFKSEEVEENQESFTLEQVYLLYLREKEFNKKSFQWQMDAMRLPLSRFGNKRLSEICFTDLSTLMEEMLRSNVKVVTVKGRLSVLKTVLRWTSEHGFYEMVRFPKLPTASYEKFIPPTKEEIEMMLKAAPPHIQRVIILGSQCGVRVGESELLKLSWEDVDFDAQLLRIHGAKKNLNSQWREVPIRDDLLKIFKAWREEDTQKGKLIHYKGKPVSSIKTAWRNMLKKAGITRRIRPYDLRHAFATELIAGGADIGTVANLMGHSSPTMIFNHYQYVMDKQKRLAIESLPQLTYVPKTMCPN